MYSPNNLCVYVYAFCGYNAGLNAARNQPTSSDESAYLDAGERADFFAQAVDQAWGAGGYTNADLQQIQSAASSLLSTGNSIVPGLMGLTQAGYTNIAAALVAGVRAGTAQIVSEGLDPNGCGGGGGGGNALNIVYVNATGTPPTPGITTHATPYTAKAFDWVICDPSVVAIQINLPTLTAGQWVSVAHDSATNFAHAITATPNSADTDQPAPLNGTFVPALTFGPGTTYWTPPSAVGMRVQFYNGGSPSGLLLE